MTEFQLTVHEFKELLMFLNASRVTGYLITALHNTICKLLIVHVEANPKLKEALREHEVDVDKYR